MIGYVGQTKSRALIAELRALGIGEATQPDEYPPRRSPWFQDNGAFKLWRAGVPFDERRFMDVLTRMYLADATAHARPDFVVIPDKVAAGAESLAYSMTWVPRLRGCAPLAFVAQDGMTEAEVGQALSSASEIAVLFVGGTLEWKLATSAGWVKLAHQLGRRCHIGRVGTKPRVQWARAIGADSVDSCTPLFSRDNMRRWLEGLLAPYPLGLWGAVAPPYRRTNLSPD